MVTQIAPFPCMTLVAPRLPLVDHVAIAPNNKANWQNGANPAAPD
jgi:hypothetical protein